MDEEIGSALMGTSKKTSDGPDGKSASYKLLWAALMLFSGTFTTLFAKALYETNGVGNESCNVNDDNMDCKFDKPWFTVLIMKLSMSLCIPIYYYIVKGKNEAGPTWVTIKAVAFPASLDLLNTVLGNIGLLYVNSSIYQMTRGSVVIFSAFLSVKLLGRTLRSFHYWAIFFVIVAVILVGLAGIETNPDGSGGTSVILGLGFILLAQAVTAVQFIAEEALMNKPETALDPVALVGFEGLWGMAYFTVLVPLLTFTPRSSAPISAVWHENFGDTMVMLSNSSGLCWLCFGYFCTILMYNIAANFVTQCLSAVVRSILEACRVMGVWIVGLLFYYCAKGSMRGIGEQWTSWSFMELFGFCILMYGTFAYKALVKIPWVDPEVYEAAEQDDRERNSKAAPSAKSITYNALLVDEEDVSY